MRTGRDPAFDLLFSALFARVVMTTQRIVGSRAAAEDIAAEAFTRAFARWSTVKAMDHPEAWILRVALNLALDVAKRRPVSIQALGPVDAAEVATLRAALAAALASLPRRQRQIVALRHLAGLSEMEVAAALGLSLGTVKTHRRRGMIALRQQFMNDEEATGFEALSS